MNLEGAADAAVAAPPSDTGARAGAEGPAPRGTGLGQRLVAVVAAGALLVLLRLGAPVIGPFLLALFFAILCRPLYVGLQRRGLSSALALLLVALGLVAAVLLLVAIVGLSVGQLQSTIATYRDQLSGRLDDLRQRFTAAGIAPPAEPSAGVAADALVGVAVAVAQAAAGLTLNLFYLLLLILFLMTDGPRMLEVARARLGAGQPLLSRLTGLGPAMVRFFGLRTLLNALTGLGVGVALWLLGIDLAALWGLLLFFLSYVPYVGIFLASAPPVVLALAEYGPGRALLVVALITAVNFSLENIFMPRLMGRGLSLSPLVVFVSFFFWTWLIGPAGALLAMFLTLLLVALLDSYEETRWLAEAMVGKLADAAGPRAGREHARQEGALHD